MTVRLFLLVAVLSMALAGCGVRPEPAPEPIAIPSDTATTETPPTMGPVDRRVYFVRSGRLVAVERQLSSGSVTTALDALVAGPTRTEVATGVRTSVAPQSFRAEHPNDSPRVVEVTAGPQLTSVSGQDQLLAVAQVVWTVTEVPGIRLVRFYLDRRPLEVPTDDGLSRHAVGRSDYMSVRPTGGS